MPSNVYFREYRNLELSVTSYIETQILANWSNITVVKSYPNLEKMVLPVIAVRVPVINSEFFEIGSRQTQATYTVYIDVFAKSDPQRQDLTSFLMDTIIVDCDYNTYAKHSTDATSIVATPAGKVVFKEFTDNSNLDFGEDTDVYDRYRQFLSYDVKIRLT